MHRFLLLTKKVKDATIVGGVLSVFPYRPLSQAATYSILLNKQHINMHFTRNPTQSQWNSHVIPCGIKPEPIFCKIADFLFKTMAMKRGLLFGGRCLVPTREIITIRRDLFSSVEVVWNRFARCLWAESCEYHFDRRWQRKFCRVDAERCAGKVLNIWFR